MGVDAAGDVDPLHLRAVLGIAEDTLWRDDARLEDLLVVVDVVDEGVQRPHPLLEAALEADPFLQGHDPRHDVEGDQPLGTLFLAVNGEGDSDTVEQCVRLGAFLAQAVGRLLLEPPAIAQVVGPGAAVAEKHFVVRFIAQKLSFDW